MAYHGIAISRSMASDKIDSLVRSAKCTTTDLDNGNIVFLVNGISSTAGEDELWLASTPTSATPTGAWMVLEPEIVMTGAYKGLDPDVRNFYTVANKEFTAVKVKTVDIVELSDAAFSNTRTNEGYVGIGVSGAKLTWQASSTNALFKFVQATKIALSSGSPGSNSVTSYRVEAVTE